MKERSKTAAENIVAEIGDEIRVRQDEVAQLQTTRQALIELYGIDTFTTTEKGKKAVASLPDRSPAAVQASGQEKRHGGGRRKKAIGVATADGDGAHGVTRPTGTAAPAVPSTEEPQTVAGAMKVIVPKLAQPFTAAQVIETLKAQYPALMETDGAELRPYGNLAYWAKTGKLTKTGDGAEAQFRNVEF